MYKLCDRIDPEKIHWRYFSTNPGIFTYDYTKMKTSRRHLHEEVIQNRFHPQNMGKFEGWGFDTELQEE